MHMDPHDLGSVLHCHTPVRLAIRTLPCHLVWWKISPPSQSLWLFINLNFYFCFSNNGSRPGKIRCLCDAASRGYFAVVVLRSLHCSSFTQAEYERCSDIRLSVTQIWFILVPFAILNYEGAIHLLPLVFYPDFFSPPSALVLPSWNPHKGAGGYPFERDEGKHSIQLAWWEGQSEFEYVPITGDFQRNVVYSSLVLTVSKPISGKGNYF